MKKLKTQRRTPVQTDDTVIMYVCPNCLNNFRDMEVMRIHTCDLQRAARMTMPTEDCNIMTTEFITKDSGQRQEFSSGMVRDTQAGKLRFDLAIDGPLAAAVFADNPLFCLFNDWYLNGGTHLGAKVISAIAEREGGLMPLFERYAGLMTRGAVKYSARNWMKASGQDEYERFRASASRHFAQYLRGDVDEDHAAAVWFNINGAEYVGALGL